MHARIGDQYVVFALASLQALAGLLLIDRAHRRLFPAVPGLFVVLAVAVFAFVNPTLYNLARAGVYEAAIVGGHAFLVTGLLFAFHAVTERRTAPPCCTWRWPASAGRWRSAAARRSPPASCCSSTATCWLAAPGTRSPTAGGGGRARSAWLGTPVAVGVACLLAYNKLRFDAWFDFGRHYQLTWIPFSGSAAFVPANAWSYVLRPFDVRCTFPFLHAVTDMGARALPAWLRPPHGYIVYEPVVGCLLGDPVGLAGARRGRGRHPPRLGARARPGRRRRGGGRASPGWPSRPRWPPSRSFIVPLTLFWATMRFLGDMTPALTLAGTLGWWLCWVRFREHAVRRRLVTSAAVVLALATVAVGVALGFEGQYKHFRQHNPALLDRLEKRLSFC